MSKILLVEPNRMLQQAIALALFPDHKVQIATELPEASELGGFDAVIVGSIALQDPGKTGRSVHGWKVPTIWLECVPGAPSPKRERLVAVSTPIEKNQLLSALAECLASRSKASDSATVPSRKKARGNGAASAAGEVAVIELVDVVEEGVAETKPA